MEFYSPKTGPTERAEIEASKRLMERNEKLDGWPLPAK